TEYDNFGQEFPSNDFDVDFHHRKSESWFMIDFVLLIYVREISDDFRGEDRIHKELGSEVVVVRDLSIEFAKRSVWTESTLCFAFVRWASYWRSSRSIDVLPL
ncbi:hypothetical protein HAX54_002904, partial [Datura stramonium]|nr:hypothetical protein [Datura stramonium]